MIDLDLGACRGLDAEWFHPAPDDVRAIERAQRVCRTCAIRLDCLALSLRAPAVAGIWGGLTERQRAIHRATTAHDRDLAGARA